MIIVCLVLVVAAFVVIGVALALAEPTLVNVALGLGGLSAVLLAVEFVRNRKTLFGRGRTESLPDHRNADVHGTMAGRDRTDGLGKASVPPPAMAATGPAAPAADTDGPPEVVHGIEDAAAAAAASTPAPVPGPVRAAFSPPSDLTPAPSGADGADSAPDVPEPGGATAVAVPEDDTDGSEPPTVEEADGRTGSGVHGDAVDVAPEDPAGDGDTAGASPVFGDRSDAGEVQQVGDTVAADAAGEESGPESTRPEDPAEAVGETADTEPRGSDAGGVGEEPDPEPTRFEDSAGDGGTAGASPVFGDRSDAGEVQQVGDTVAADAAGEESGPESTRPEDPAEAVGETADTEPRGSDAGGVGEEPDPEPTRPEDPAEAVGETADDTTAAVTFREPAEWNPFSLPSREESESRNVSAAAIAELAARWTPTGGELAATSSDDTPTEDTDSPGGAASPEPDDGAAAPGPGDTETPRGDRD